MKNTKQVLAVVLIVILVVNIVLFAMKKISMYVFWAIIILAASYVYLTKKFK